MHSTALQCSVMGQSRALALGRMYPEALRHAEYDQREKINS